MIIKLDEFDKKHYYIPWDTLTTATIRGDEGWFSKNVKINDSSYPMGRSNAKLNEWSNYINEMVSVYKSKMSKYESYVSMVNRLSNTPEDFKTFFASNSTTTNSTNEQNQSINTGNISPQKQKIGSTPISIHHRFIILKDEFDEEFWNSNKGRFPIDDMIPRKKASNVVNSYAKNMGIRESDIKLLFDETLFGSAKDGFIITDKYIVGSKNKTAFPIENVNSISLVHDSNNKYNLKVVLEPMHQVITDCTKSDDFETLIAKINSIIFHK